MRSHGKAGQRNSARAILESCQMGIADTIVARCITARRKSLCVQPFQSDSSVCAAAHSVCFQPSMAVGGASKGGVDYCSIRSIRGLSSESQVKPLSGLMVIMVLTGRTSNCRRNPFQIREPDFGHGHSISKNRC